MANKLAVITGASTGIGKEIAKIAAREGYDLIVVADEPTIDAAAGELNGFGVAVEAVEADLVIRGLPLPTGSKETVNASTAATELRVCDALSEQVFTRP